MNSSTQDQVTAGRTGAVAGIVGATRPATTAWAERVARYDGFVVVTPECNGGPPGVLENALDTVWGEWNGKPFQVVAYGFHGGDSAAQQQRTVLG